jgi:putative Mg2+ transporter-C (MgtC) family protein
MPSDWELVLRLVLAAALSGALGVERELTEQPAGVRTHMLVGMGAALFAIVSAFGFIALTPTPSGAAAYDPTRIAAQIVVGIGFLGAGVIVKSGGSVRGLTTAASFWITAAIGTAAGFGMTFVAVAVTVITLVALVGGRPFRSLLRRHTLKKKERAQRGQPEENGSRPTADRELLGSPSKR